MQVSIYPGVERSSSIDRYGRELAHNFPTGFAVRTITGRKSHGWRGIVDKYIRYPGVARQQQGDYNIVLSESNAFLLLFLKPERTIIICHDVHPLCFKLGSVAYRMRFRINLRLMKRARKIVAVSGETQKDLAKFCPFIRSDKVTVVHNGIESHWRPISNGDDLESFRKKYNLDGRKAILHVGNDMKHKNVATILQAVARLTDPEVIFVKVGPIGPENQVLIASLGIGERIYQFEDVSDEELVLFYNSASVLVFPSLREGFGWPPLEAMACACPVITSAAGSLPEVCSDACLYVDPLDINGMVETISSVLRDETLREELVRKGKIRARVFNWESTVEGILNAFE